jgi:hypothetical protein
MLASLKRNELIDVLFLIVIYNFGIVILNPFGDFPLNDDWSDWRPIDWIRKDGYRPHRDAAG